MKMKTPCSLPPPWLLLQRTLRKENGKPSHAIKVSASRRGQGEAEETPIIRHNSRREKAKPIESSTPSPVDPKGKLENYLNSKKKKKNEQPLAEGRSKKRKLFLAVAPIAKVTKVELANYLSHNSLTTSSQI